MQVQGIVVPLVTPLRDNECVDRQGLRRLIENMVTAGIDGIFVAGTTGEYARLQARQRHCLFALAAEYTANRMVVYAGVTDSSLRAVRDHIQAAKVAGVDCCVAGLPYYFPVHDDAEAFAWFAELVACSSLPLLLYDIPGHAQAALSPTVVTKLASSVAGVKDSSGNPAKLTAFIEALGGCQRQAAYLSGSEALTRQAVAQGADGLVPSLGNVLPQLLATLWEKRHDPQELDHLASVMDKINHLNGRYSGSVASIAWKKRVLALQGVCADTLSLPSTAVPEADNPLLLREIEQAAAAVDAH
ncbi:MAG: dihydrodipicolinate synthase family protein [Limnochordia bacterium]